ncbi:hypothetical protein [Actibacterium lipolyticum]|uniref:Uncharacterized protein n=1 Tax=Actibacterium lipolyticum TaxID=1524263 RepID=A0A238JTB6_9RHOB|nr:hypothetical protein [Actibacterium lipolyticum]SMX33899.1 hypothetical protein COL8621_01121 [Actibacterium lipolyticum]
MTVTAFSTVRGVALSALTASAALTLPSTAHERAEVFAKCSGRLSALATNQRALKNPDVSTTERAHQNFEMMLSATLPDAIERGVPTSKPILWHASGWSEIAYLLADIQYSNDEIRAQRAKDAIEQRIDDCSALIL